MRGKTIRQEIFYPASGVIILFVLCGALLPEQMGTLFAHIQTFIVEKLGWFYTVSVTFFLIFVIWLFFSPYGHTKLGKDDDEPDYSYPTWFAMLFSAGMGIGLVFYGVAEPILHFSEPRTADPYTIDAAREAMRLTFMHWGLHAWGIYIVVGMSLAYFAFRHNLPLTISSTLYPLLGKRVYGPLGHTVEVFAIFGTLFGIATSLGLGSMQINAGLDYLGILPISMTNQVLLIIGISLIATISVASGLDRGIRRLSEFNMLAALFLILFVLLTGPTAFLLQSLPQSIGNYLQHLPQMSLQTDAFRGLDWQKSWTMFYWGWWISWSPFVGMFIARISRGRTIREFIAGVLLVPALLTFIWIVIFGGTALYFELFRDTAIVAAVSENIATSLFVLLNDLPLPALTSTIAVMVITLFFVTSSDSGSLVTGILSCGGKTEVPVFVRLFWALAKGAVAIVLLIAGGLAALQTAAITTALPFCVILLLMCWSLHKALRVDSLRSRRRLALAGMAPALTESELEFLEMQARLQEDDNHWQQRLTNLLHEHKTRLPEETPAAVDKNRQVMRFIQDTVIPAFAEIRRELQGLDYQARLERQRSQATIAIGRDGDSDFSYTIQAHAYRHLQTAFPGLPRDNDEAYFIADIIVNGEHRRRYAMSYFTRQSIMESFLEEYTQWLNE